MIKLNDHAILFSRSHFYSKKTMTNLRLILAATLTLMIFNFSVAQDDWSRWRGPTGNGIAAEGQTPPTEWDTAKNVVWKTKIPGRGHASPMVIGNRIFLATADKNTQTQSVLCVSRDKGEKLWETQVSSGGFPERIHPKNTHASSTIATDGKRLFAVFLNHAAVHVAALDLDGKEIWKQRVGDYNSQYPFGFGASPIYHDGLVYVSNEGRVDSAVVVYEAASGKEQFRISRGKNSSYSTPVIATVAGKSQLLLSGGSTVKSYDPKTGKENWSAPAQWQVSCGTMVWDGDLVFISGGFPAQQTLAVDAKNGNTVWTNRIKSYEQSLLAVDGYIYVHGNNSVLYCFRAKDGQEMWKQKFSSKNHDVSVSPTLVGGNIYFTAENGETVVAKLNPEKYEEVARNKLGTSAFASPAFCGNQIFTRVGDGSQEWLYCLGEK
jgi:outer membrane protein assembly factor BamB